MLSFADIRDDAERALGAKSDDEYLLSRVRDSIEILASKGDWDGIMFYADLCCVDRCIVLPPEIETVEALTADGFPSTPRDRLFQFHLNGPGTGNWTANGREWMDDGLHPVTRQPVQPARIAAIGFESADENLVLKVWGVDKFQKPILGVDASGNPLPYYEVPIFVRFPAYPANAPEFARIVSVEKPVTKGRVQLFCSDWSNAASDPSGALLGDYGPFETRPRWRRLRVNFNTTWVRVWARRSVDQWLRWSTLIPLQPRYAVVAMLRALKAYDDGDLASAEGYEATALRWLSERQRTMQPPINSPIQISMDGGIADGSDDLQSPS